MNVKLGHTQRERERDKNKPIIASTIKIGTKYDTIQPKQQR